MASFVRGILIVAIITGIPNLVRGQGEQQSFHHPTVSVGFGVTAVTGDSAGELNANENFQANGGYFFNLYFGITGNFMFTYMDITRTALDSLNEPGGFAKVYALTADPTVRLPLRHGFSVYALAGGGFVRRTLHFHAPALVPGGVTHLPFGLEPGAVVTAIYTNDAGGFDAGGGVNMPWPWWGAKLFIESRYFKGFTSNTYTTVLPVTIGFRW